MKLLMCSCRGDRVWVFFVLFLIPHELAEYLFLVEINTEQQGAEIVVVLARW